MTVLALAAAVTAATALPAQVLPAPAAVTWEAVVEEADGRTSIDPRSLVRAGDVVRFLVRNESRTPRPDGTSVLVMRIAMDCRRRAIGMQAADSYGEGGRFVASLQAGPGGIAFAPLGGSSGHARLYARVCPAAGAGR